MKSKLKISAAIAVLLSTSIVSSLAQYPGGAPGAGFNPATGLPFAQTGAAPGAPVMYDPTTGQPIAQAAPEWKDPNWKDPDITLTNVTFPSLAISEVATWLREKFKEQFDILLPAAASDSVIVNGQPVTIGWQKDWQSEPITLQLKNVTASEIFSAMNLVFENNRTPLRWELKVNGHRQIALLRVLADPMPMGAFGVPGIPDKQRRVYFVGNLIGDEKNGGMTMEQIINTNTDVWQMADASGGNIQFHKEAQLLVVSGTPNQIDFMEQTLKALEQKVNQGEIDQVHRSTMHQILKDFEQPAKEPKTNSASRPR
jgi:hypothetical protein